MGLITAPLLEYWSRIDKQTRTFEEDLITGPLKLIVLSTFGEGLIINPPQGLMVYLYRGLKRGILVLSHSRVRILQRWTDERFRTFLFLTILDAAMNNQTLEEHKNDQVFLLQVCSIWTNIWYNEVLLQTSSLTSQLKLESSNRATWLVPSLLGLTKRVNWLRT